MSLAKQIIEHEKLGSSCRSSSLGFCRMPEGYSLMLDADETFFYWLRHDGVQSDVAWDKWAIWRGACANLSNHPEAKEIEA